MATVDKIRNDIAKTKEKIAELQKKQRSLEAQLAEEMKVEVTWTDSQGNTKTAERIITVSEEKY